MFDLRLLIFVAVAAAEESSLPLTTEVGAQVEVLDRE